jgi:uncharacterized protein YecE (DUF72 family)
VAKLYVGLSGFSYPEWRGEGRFYPSEMKQTEFFGYYVTRFNAVEADHTWYRMPAKDAAAKWNATSPEGFRFSPKMHREVSHMKRLKPDSLGCLRTFVERLQTAEQNGRLGAILLQMPPNFRRNDERLAEFLSEIPYRETLQWSFEFRDESWRCPEVFSMLRERNVSWVEMDTDEHDAKVVDTARHFYVRLRKGDYTDDQLRDWAAILKERLQDGMDCYVYCKHQDAEAPWIWADRIVELTG